MLGRIDGYGSHMGSIEYTDRNRFTMILAHTSVTFHRGTPVSGKLHVTSEPLAGVAIAMTR